MNFELTEKEYTNGMIDEIYKRSKNIGYNIDLQSYDMFLIEILASGVHQGDDIKYLENCFDFNDSSKRYEKWFYFF